MTRRPAVDNLRDRIESIEEDMGYGDLDMSQLYMLSLKHASENAPDYPEGVREYRRRLQRAAQHDDGSESEEGRS